MGAGLCDGSAETIHCLICVILLHSDCLLYTSATPRFELFMGCLGNRIAVCNKAVEENGDYKMVAHISIEGNVIWCIAPGDAPAKDVIKIRHVADMERNRYEVWLSTLSEMERYA